MSLSSPNENDHSGLSELSADSREIADYYDDWAENYDQTLEQWNYQSPAVAAELLKRETPLEGDILDAGCGTGLIGSALQAAGFQHLTGTPSPAGRRPHVPGPKYGPCGRRRRVRRRNARPWPQPGYPGTGGASPNRQMAPSCPQGTDGSRRGGYD